MKSLLKTENKYFHKKFVNEKIVIELNNNLLKESIIELYTNLNNKPYNYRAIRFKKKITLKCEKTGFYTAKVRYRLPEHKQWTYLQEHNIHIEPEWWRKAIVYNAFVRSFGAKRISKHGEIVRLNAGTFDDLKERLPEIKKLGVNTLYLNPIHMIGELYRKTDVHDYLPTYLQPGSPYSIKDYKSIDPDFAFHKTHNKYSDSDPKKEFKELISLAHKLGIKVFMDLVFNHTAHDAVFQRQHPEWYLYKENILDNNSPYIYPEEIVEGKPWGDAKYTTSPFDHGYFWEDVAQLNWEYKNPPAPNNSPKNPTLNDMWEYFKKIPQYWIKNYGIDGFRCDVAYQIPPNFWNECIYEARQVAKKSYPKNNSLTGDIVFIAETYVDDLNILLNAGFTSCYGDYHNKLYSVLTLKGYLDYIYNISGNHFPEGTKWFLFPECHDWIRLPEKIALESLNAFGPYNANKSRWTLTALLLGIPMIFNGFEKVERSNVNIFSVSKINWERDEDLGDHITLINNIRKKHLAFTYGDYQFIPTNKSLEKSKIFAFSREYEGKKFIIAVNMDINNSQTEELQLSSMPETYKLKDLITNKIYERQGNNLLVILPMGESHVFEVNP